MNTRKNLLLALMVFLCSSAIAQRYDAFLDRYQLNKTFHNEHPKQARDYSDCQGSPYLEREFAEGTLYMKDTTAVKLQLRLNLYTDQFEYKLNDTNYVVGEPYKINRVILGNSVFIYLPFITKPGYFELLAAGKSFLVLKRTVEFKPSEGPKPIEGTITPARFDRNPDDYFIVVNGSQVVEVNSMKSVINAFQDQKAKVEEYINTQKLKRATMENLIKIVDYYNSL